MHRPRAFDAFSRRTAFAALVLFFVGSIASSLHMALVRHAVCAEHGEVVHLAPADATPVCGASAQAHPGSVWSPAPSASEDGHDHCTIAAQTRVRGMAWTPYRAAPQSEPEVVARDCAPGPARVPGFSRLFLAPKHSPPV